MDAELQELAFTLPLLFREVKSIPVEAAHENEPRVRALVAAA